jgi:hypothetical protein
MRILFDHGAPRGLARQLLGHRVTIAKSMGWARLSNGNLLSAAERAGFDLLLTTDQGIRYQQNLSARKISLLVLTGSIKWTQVRLYVERVAVALSEVAPGSYAEVFIPFEARPPRPTAD